MTLTWPFPPCAERRRAVAWVVWGHLSLLELMRLLVTPAVLLAVVFVGGCASRSGAPRYDAALSRELLAMCEVDHWDGECRDVDLLIRTGGEQRLSDFLLWECAYAELYFTERRWPDFSPADLQAAVKEFHSRERRFGTVPEAAAG